jgi:hypothetical protein
MPVDDESKGETVKLATKTMLKDLGDVAGNGFNDVYEASA